MFTEMQLGAAETVHEDICVVQLKDDQHLCLLSPSMSPIPILPCWQVFTKVGAQAPLGIKFFSQGTA